MNFDLRSPDSAYSFILNFLNMNRLEFIEDYRINCECNFEKFWSEHFDEIDAVDISDLRIIAFHITGSIDDCAEIQSKGLINLQMAVSKDTVISRFFRKYELLFDVEKRLMNYKGHIIDLNNKENGNQNSFSPGDNAIINVANRLFYDYFICGFLVNDDIYSYGTDIDKRPEFFMRLVLLFPDLAVMEHEWIEKHKSYCIAFITRVAQVCRSNFELDEYRDPPYENWTSITDDQKLKKWMLSHAIDRAANELGKICLCIKNEVIIPPEQFISCCKI